MYTARAKRRENIAEYILYLWQLEDMLRALEMSPEAIYSTLVEPHTELDEQKRQELFFWYMDMVNLLQTEGKRHAGHMEHTEHLISDLQDLHNHLLQSPIGQQKGYTAVFGALSGELPKLKAAIKREDKSGNVQQTGDIEACFKALYSVVLCRLKSKTQVGDQQQATDSQYINDVCELVSPVIATLAAIHRAAEQGEIDLYKGL